jgi:hypothetical protein
MQGMQRHPGPSYDQSQELRVRPDLKTLQLRINSVSAKQDNDTSTARPVRADSLDQDVNSIEVEESLKRHVCENENRK